MKEPVGGGTTPHRPRMSAGGHAALFLHIGEDVVIDVQEVVAILEAASVERADATRSFLRLMQAEGRVKQISQTAPSTYVVTGRNVYATPISAATLARRNLSSGKSGVGGLLREESTQGDSEGAT